MNSQKTQGFIFSMSAWLLLVAAGLFPVLRHAPNLAFISIIIFLFGIPHGALDIIYAYSSIGNNKLTKWISFILFYFFAIMLVIIAWLLTPVLFLIGFLCTSVFHFSGDPSPGTPIITRLLYGAAIIVMPTLTHQAEVARLFEYLVDAKAAIFIVTILHNISLIWLIGLIIAIILRLRQDWLSALEIFSTSMLAIFLSPLLAFTIFFCCMHSARHILRTLNYFSNYPKLMLVGTAVIPMILTTLLVGIIWYWDRNTPLDKRTLQLLFVGLAALTVPHMAVIEPIRIKGWKKVSDTISLDIARK